MLSLPELVAAFPAIVWARGIDIAYTGRVVGLTRDTAGVWTAEVQGSKASPYRVHIAFVGGSQGAVGGGCSCPADKPCKHMAAVALSAFNEGQRGSPISSAAPRTIGRSAADLEGVRSRRAQARAEQARANLAKWARMVGSTERAEAPIQSSSSGPRKQLVFVVSIETSTRYGDARPRVAVDTRVQTVLKNGKGGKAVPFSVTEMMLRLTQPRPSWIDEADIALWYRIHSLARGEPGAYGWGTRAAFAHRPEAAGLFAELVATARARFGSVDGRVLRYGPPRAGGIVWRIDDAGTQRLTIESDGDVMALPLVPLHYIDGATGLCGRLELPIPDEIGPWIVAAPAIDPELAGALPQDLAARLRGAGLPPPRIVAPRRLANVEVTPILRLHARHPDDAGRAGASLSYGYGGHEIAAGSEHRRVHRLEGDELVVIERDRDAEAAAFNRLVELGFAGDVAELTLPGPARWPNFGGAQAEALRRAGWHVEADPDFEWQAIDPDAWYADGSADPNNSNGWFLELGVVVDGQRIPILPLVVEAIRRGLIARGAIGPGPIALPLPDGRRVAIAAERLRVMLDVLVELSDEKPLMNDALALQPMDVARLEGLVGFDVVLAPKLAAAAERLRTGPIVASAPPPGLGAGLRDYQLGGLAWLGWLRASGLGGILADDMGLGKTAQALAHLLAERAADRLHQQALVVAPRSVLKNWQREADRFAPTLRTAVYHGQGRERVLAEDSVDLVITTHALLQRDAALRARSWSVVVLDEAQAIKNAEAKVSIAARELVAEQRICMTGTPMENNLGDLWSLMTFANPGLLGTSRQFSRWYRTPIEKEADTDRFSALARRIAPFVLRRTKAQVLAELPPKTEVVLHAVLEGPQRDLYESVRVTMEKRVRDELRARGLARSRIIVLDALLKLRQVCCHPPLARLGRARDVGESAKLDLLLELVGELVAEGRRALVFSQFTSMLAVIERSLDVAKIPWLAITGKTTARQEIVDRFQAGEVPILLVSLKAGGTGLNLTAADTVIHYDPWWNPAVEAQATDRAHRLGQTQKITVYRLICEGTVEERMVELQARKAALVAGLHASAERRSASGFALEAGDIAELLAPIDDGSSERTREPDPRKRAQRRA